MGDGWEMGPHSKDSYIALWSTSCPSLIALPCISMGTKKLPFVPVSSTLWSNIPTTIIKITVAQQKGDKKDPQTQKECRIKMDGGLVASRPHNPTPTHQVDKGKGRKGKGKKKAKYCSTLKTNRLLWYEYSQITSSNLESANTFTCIYSMTMQFTSS